MGLGNIWKFPYVVGQNGGAAFIVIYLVISLLISIPVILSEFAVGRGSQKNTLGAFRSLSRQKGWQSIGYLGILTALVILSFYCVIAGWSLEFIKESVLGEFMHSSQKEVADHFREFVDSGWRSVAWALGFLALNCVVLVLGINKGIERCSKFMMPVLVVLLFGMAVGSIFLGGWTDSMEFLFKPDWSKIDGKTVVMALGQSFFSLSLGMGTMITYGSYINKKENLLRVAGTVVVTDTLVAIMAGLAIFPAVFTFGISPTSGADLVFLTLPTLFAQIPGGYFLSIAFFVLLFFAAITSSFSILEVIIAYLSEEFRMSRTMAVVVSFVVIGVLSTLCALSQTPTSCMGIGRWDLLQIFDYVSSNYMLPIGGLATVIFAGWVMKKRVLRREITTGGHYGKKLFPVLRFMLRYVVPTAIVVMFLSLAGVI